MMEQMEEVWNQVFLLESEGRFMEAAEHQVVGTGLQLGRGQVEVVTHDGGLGGLGLSLVPPLVCVFAIPTRLYLC